MDKVCFFDTKPYDKLYFDTLSANLGIGITYFESRLKPETTVLCAGCRAVVAFVNDEITAEVIDLLCAEGVELLALRSAGYNNVDIKAARGKLKIVRVPEYSPYAVAEHTAALLLSLNRKIHRAYIRVRDYNFSLNNLIGFDLHGKTAGVIGTGKIGLCFIDILKGFGMKILAFDPYPKNIEGVTYCGIDELMKNADVISLHCPLTKETHHIINKHTLSLMKKNAVLINTSRGALIDTEELLKALKAEKIGGAALDVYEEESEFFFEDHSLEVIKDDVLSQIIALPNVVLTSHQAFLTHEALKKIAEVTLTNLRAFFDGKPLEYEVL